MNKLNQYHEMKRLEAKLARDLQKLEESNELKQELAFADELKKLMTEYDIAPADLISIVTPPSASSTTASKGRAKGQERLYRNPHSGEEVRCYRANKILKAWMSQYGKDVVESWRV